MINKATLVKQILRVNIRKVCDVFNLKYDFRIMENFAEDEKFLEQINTQIVKNNAFRIRHFESIYQFSVYRNMLYYLIRILKPETVVETGVLHGLTSTWILKAIAENKKGKLISIDLPRRDWHKFFPKADFGPGGEQDLELPDNEMPGWIIPENLKSNWQFLLGPSNQYLDKVSMENKIDLFIHDSDHSYEIMKYECEQILKSNPEAFLVIDDFNQNNFFYEYLSKNNVKHMFVDEVDDNLRIVTCTAMSKALKENIDNSNSDRGLGLMYNLGSNRRWQEHLKSKGLDAFIYDRLMMYSLTGPKDNNAFDFRVEKEEDNELARHWFNWMEEFPYPIYVEVTNKCNLSCTMCARTKMNRPLGVMSYELFKKIIDEVALSRPVCYLHIYGVGDPLMDPGILKKMEYSCCVKRLPNQLFGTNGTLLMKNDIYKPLVDMNIPQITVDIDGFSKQTYEKIRVGGNFEQIIKTIETVYDYIRRTGSRTRFDLIYQIIPGINEHEVGRFTKWCEDNGYEYKLITLHSWAGLRKEYVRSLEVSRTTPCRAQWDGMTIYWNGDVGTCFQDANGYEIFGNVMNQNIKEIWQGSLRKRRSEHVQGIFKGLCKNCQSFIKSTLPTFNSSIYPSTLKTQFIKR